MVRPNEDSDQYTGSSQTSKMDSFTSIGNS